jgi:hypothetical protein
MAEDGGAPAQKRQETVRYTREEALEAARPLTGQSRMVVAGALATDSENRESWTENQLNKLVKDFVKAPDHPEEDAE